MKGDGLVVSASVENQKKQKQRKFASRNMT